MNNFETTNRWYLPKRSHSRLITAITVSLVIHGIILSLQLGISGVGLPGLLLPWSERRAPELTIRIANTKNVSAPPLVSEESVPDAAIPPSSTFPIDVRPAAITAETPPPTIWRPHLPEEAVKKAPPNKNQKLLSMPDRQHQPKKPSPKVIVQDEPRESAFMVPVPSAMEPPSETVSMIETPNESTEIMHDQITPALAPLTANASLAIQDQAKITDEENIRQAQELEKAQKEEAAKKQAAESLKKSQSEEAARQRAAALVLEKQVQDAQKISEEVLRVQAIAAKQREELNLEKAKAEEASRRQAAALAIEIARQAAIKRANEETAKHVLEMEAKKLEDEKKEAKAKAARLEMEAIKKAEETARQAAAQKQAEELAAKEKAQEIADRQKAEMRAKQQEQERLAASNAAKNSNAKGTGKLGEIGEIPGSISGRDLIGKALNQSRSIDLSDTPAMTRKSMPAGLEDTRRRTFFGGIDKDIGMTMYIESWRQKIERNGGLNYAHSSNEKARGDMIVNVAIRSDGTVENVTIIRSSGRPELADAVRRIIRLNAPYSVFPPNLARQYDVVEIRRIWNFEDRLRVVEEVR